MAHLGGSAGTILGSLSALHSRSAVVTQAALTASRKAGFVPVSTGRQSGLTSSFLVQGTLIGVVIYPNILVEGCGAVVLVHKGWATVL